MRRDPLEMAKEIAKLFHPFSTILLKIFIDVNGKRRILQVGSGTYVQIGESYGILTAYHCIEKLTGEYLLGVNAASEGKEHNLFLDPKCFELLCIDNPKSEEYGPDLAFITIADWEKVSTISASKSFYKLSRERELLLTSPPKNSESAWYICGIPNITFLPGESDKGFDEMFEYMQLCGAVGIDRVYSRDGYDYCEMDFIQGSGDAPPSTFGGMSGGGLWQVPWPPADSPPDHLPDLFLSGVIFYQGPLENDTRFLRCHFRESVYRNVIDALS